MKLPKLLILLVLLGFAIAAPFFAYPIFLMKILSFALFAAAFNLLLGYTGLLSFGHAAFFGGAGYCAGYLMRDMGVGPAAGIAIGVLFAAALGALIGGLAIRRQGIYFSMITLALAQMFYFICLQAPASGGEDGFQGIPRGDLFGLIDLQNDLNLYYFVLAITVAGFVFIQRIITSPFGQVLKAIKENEPRAISLGYKVNRFKFLVFVLSAALAGLAGSTQALVLGFETLTDVHWTMSGLVILMTLVGGVGTMAGPFVGALVIVLLEHRVGEIGNFLAEITSIAWFNSLGESVTIVTGLIFIFCVMAFRRGLVGIFTKK
ncbi:branched-chain amino acid ABC transporter permease [Polynucleobacter asymbioticus]|uniref:Amino acid/amide ABC transporter membrane protein 2, HAAT family n=1 Tax=Polynucleobacter asymbioticus (strain DSM 18221 / CIP 109841 / QLW-P1DMWA-1) TaxID=312153 RepID=A4SUR8_POLAQ|nr:branched-chain amino acid ABC transporter permease [Polynucleobacter asymbioticus]ABP33232.1 amino acid/amide ABC transporter membrane protein 2, HAAT family [Polynucleobacter asymbioticus QLW-P1DMWA-1]